MNPNSSSAAFLAALESHKGIIYKIAHSYARDPEDRKDLIQEITVQLWRSFARYDDQYKLSTWFYRIALNVSISFNKRERRRKAISTPMSDSIIYMQKDTDPEEANPELQRLQQFIAELKELDRALMLLFLEGKSQKEMADILGLTVTNVATKISRIKHRLKQRFSTVNNQ